MVKINGLEKMSYAELTDMEAQIDWLKIEKQMRSEMGASAPAGLAGRTVSTCMTCSAKAAGHVAVRTAIPRAPRTPDGRGACRAGWLPRPRAARPAEDFLIYDHRSGAGP